MGAMLRYSCTALLGLNKQGIIKPNQDGYYELVLSALNYPNPVGARYRVDSARRILDTSPFFRRKIKEGNLLGETGHPRRRDSNTDADYEDRLYDIVESNVCLHISDVWIDDSGALKDRDGRSYTGIMGLVAPSGVHGDKFEASLQNPKQNTCLSVRSITDNYRMPDGSVEKEFVNIIAWDWVNEPGLRPANKFSAPSLESYRNNPMDQIIEEEMALDRARLDQLIQRRIKFDDGMESDSISIMRDVANYQRREATNMTNVKKATRWMNW